MGLEGPDVEFTFFRGTKAELQDYIGGYPRRDLCFRMALCEKAGGLPPALNRLASDCPPCTSTFWSRNGEYTGIRFFML